MDQYTVTIGGIEHTLLLDPEDAKRYPDAKKATTANKAQTTPASKAQTAPANKGR